MTGSHEVRGSIPLGSTNNCNNLGRLNWWPCVVLCAHSVPASMADEFSREVWPEELSKLRVYDLRHSCATLLLAAGENPKVVSERLGHASIVLTLDTYSHVLPSMQQAATEKLEAMLFQRAATC
jgi:Phage integrase family